MRTQQERKSKIRRARIIRTQDVDVVFDDSCIQRLAKIAKLPAEADLKAFGGAIREAARIYIGDVHVPTANELHAEITCLYKAADGREFLQTAMLWHYLSPEARDLLTDRGARPNVNPELPEAEALLDADQREAACEAIAALCRVGVVTPKPADADVDGGQQPSDRRRRTPRTALHAPDPRRHFPKRAAERNLVMWLSIAYLEATGKEPRLTARHANEARVLGPFASIVGECLRLLGAETSPYKDGVVDPVELINSAADRPKKAQQNYFADASAVLEQIARIVGCDLNALEQHFSIVDVAKDPADRLTALRRVLGIYGTSENILDAVGNAFRERVRFPPKIRLAANNPNRQNQPM
jgi:hypothetical protein